MKIFGFEKLQVWQKSRLLSVEIYKITVLFPSEEKFGIISQMRRAAISISSNIAEGAGRHSSKDQARFTEIAFGSALELLNQIILSYDLGFINEEKYLQIRQDLTEITAMLDGLYKSQKRNIP
ncbi:MAG TPA: four helix bundle protein [Aequorivita sp.]|nr:four helix bundle protein [Aequorivita sp.]